MSAQLFMCAIQFYIYFVIFCLFVQETAAANGVTAMPTFLFFRNKTKIDLLRGADAGSLEEKIRKWYGSGDENEDETIVKGQVSDISSCVCNLKMYTCSFAFPLWQYTKYDSVNIDNCHFIRHCMATTAGNNLT